MKVMTQSKWMRTLVGAAGAGALLFGMGMSGSALAGISDTKHNLGTGGSGTNKTTAGTAEICVFCHTPHAANTTVVAPLWNKRLDTSVTTYSTYSSTNSTTITGQVLSVGSVSLACLSCHDGTQAMDNIINAPGSGGYDSTGGGDNGLGYTWTGARVGTEGNLTGIANLGGGTLGGTTADLTNDHPIGIQYCGGGITGGSGTSVTGTCTDVDFENPSTDVINGTQVFWVDTGTAGRQKTDMILYPRDFSAGNGTPSVECASCHDPHRSDTATFLRIANTGSAVCLACHTK